MKVKDLIRQLTEFDMEKEVCISVDYEHEDVIGGKCKGYSFPIERIELFAGGVDILFPSDMADHMVKASTIKELEKIKAVIRFNGLYNEQIEDLIDMEIKEWKGENKE